MKEVVLGLVYLSHETAAAVMVDGEIKAACEQERYTLDKHSRRFPLDAAMDCLRLAGCSMEDVSEVAFAGDTRRYIEEFYLKPALADPGRLSFLIGDIERIKLAHNVDDFVCGQLGFTGPIRHYGHHLCHLASAYYPSGFDEALLLSHDGFGEIESGVLASGKAGEITVLHDGNRYPHSLGVLYSAVTAYLGFQHNYDEGIVMGLAPYGDADAEIPGRGLSYLDVFRDILVPDGLYGYRVNPDWTAYYYERDVWVSPRFVDTLGPRRDPNGPIEDRHRHVAAALQHRLEEIVLGQLAAAKKESGHAALAIAGGVGLNCSLNGRILAEAGFEEVFVQPASGDSGLAVGACYLARKRRGHDIRPARRHRAGLGSAFSSSQIEACLKGAGHTYERCADASETAARLIHEGRIVGWFQGGAEFGPRALGHRSILCRPFPAGMKDHLNNRVKFREEFRPFAPAVLAERAGEYFEIGQDAPHMLYAVQARPEMADRIPAVVHVDGSCRVQTVSRDVNEPFYRLISAFDALSGVPVVLNTSFNVKGQPIVNTPEQAVACFLSTNIDSLVIGDFLLTKP